MFHVDVSRSAAACLAFSHDVLAERGLAGRLGSENLGDPGLGDAADAKRHVEREGASGDGFHLHLMGFAEAHNAALAVFFDDIVQSAVEHDFFGFFHVHVSSRLIVSC